MRKLVMGFILGMVITGFAFAAEYPWVLKKNEDGIRVSVRKVEGSSILEYRGTVTVDAGLAAAVALFEDDARMTEWFHKCSEARTLGDAETFIMDPSLAGAEKERSQPERLWQKKDAPVLFVDKLLYFVISMPWPVTDRDLVFRRSRSTDPVTGVVEYRTSAEPRGYPEQKRKVRMPYLKGLWRFTPLADGRTEIYYQQHSEVGGHIPAWLVNKLSVNIPFNSLSRFRELLKTQGMVKKSASNVRKP